MTQRILSLTSGLIALAGLLAATAAPAQGLTRAQVVAELQRARASGELTAMQSERPEAFGRAELALGGSKPATALAANTRESQAQKDAAPAEAKPLSR